MALALPSDRVEVTPTHYVINGEKYSRTTSVIEYGPQPGLEKWKERVGEEEAERIKEETGKWGSDVHLMTALWDTGEHKKCDAMLRDNPLLVPVWCSWQDWTTEYVIKWICVEQVVYSKVLRMAGQVDRIALIKGMRKPTAIDLKTKRQLDVRSVEGQVGGYSTMYNEGRKTGKVESGMAVHLPRTDIGELRVKWLDLKKGEEDFMRRWKEYANVHF